MWVMALLGVGHRACCRPCWLPLQARALAVADGVAAGACARAVCCALQLACSLHHPHSDTIPLMLSHPPSLFNPALTPSLPHSPPLLTPSHSPTHTGMSVEDAVEEAKKLR